MSVIHINAFHSKQDNLVEPQPTSWDVIVQFLTSPPSIIDDKCDIAYFNAARYKDVDQIPDYTDLWYMDPCSGDSYAKRRQLNITELDLLILDYDGGLTIEQAKDRFSEYEYVCYSSFGHLEDGETHKFRIILRLATPIPAWKQVSQNGSAPDYGDWYLIRGSLEQFTGPCDPKSFDPNQIYALPSTHPSRLETSVSFYHPGKRLDWTQFDKVPIETGDLAGGYHNASGGCQTDEQTLAPDQVLKTKYGRIRVSDVVGKVSDVFCPFHDDTSPSAFLRRVEKTGNVFLYCSSTQCNRKYYMRAGGTEGGNVSNAETPGGKDSRNTTVDNKTYTAEEILDLPPQYYDAEDRTRVLKQLEKIQRSIEFDRPHHFEGGGFTCKSHILYMPEGAGKSHLVVNLAKYGHKILFACKSWEQIEGKYEEYLTKGLQEGFSVRVIRSKDVKSRRRFGTKLVRGAPSKPFSAGRILDDESVELFIQNNPDLSADFIRLSWQFFSSDRLTFEYIPQPEIDDNGNIVDEKLVAPLANEKSSIVLTTFEQLRIHRLRGARIPSDWIIWFDDPDITDVIDIEPHDEERWGELTAERLEKETREINGKQYYIRNPNQSLGYSLRNYKCVYTTTEVITRKAIERMMKQRKEQYVVHDEMDNIASGVSADRNPRLCAAVRFQSENQVVVNTAYRAADFVPVSVRTQA